MTSPDSVALSGSAALEPAALEPAARAYLGLLRRCLTRELFLDQEWWDADLSQWPGGAASVRPLLRERAWRMVRRGDPEARADGCN